MGPFCRDGDFRSGIPDLASDRRLDHCGVGEVSADSLHSRSCSWRITSEPASFAVLIAASTGLLVLANVGVLLATLVTG